MCSYNYYIIVVIQNNKHLSYICQIVDVIEKDK